MIISVGQIGSGKGREFLKMWRTVVDPANRMLQDHRHGNFEIAMVTSGGGVYQTATGIYPIEKGDVFVFPSNEPHWILEIFDGGLEIINLHFNDVFFQEGCGIAQLYPNLFFSHSQQFCSRICAGESASLCGLLKTIAGELEAGKPESKSCIQSCLNLVFISLVRLHGYYFPDEGTHMALERIRGSLQFIDEHYAEEITLDQIAAASGLSPNYFTSLFRKCFHVKLWDHVLSKRVDKAKRLLSAESEMTVLNVALSCGFHNTANFNRIFLRFTGLTPSQFRRGVPIH